ncbi:MAG: helix-turn-helix domain-containing protein [Myxacorys chilensis ATA2-1-KO14]|jgi:transcriptional regulator with XRE-family HTH domain|nr:helix-turn-helix domain-containing protein [Myxacorys chilensis ATA2-1-KO14]
MDLRQRRLIKLLEQMRGDLSQRQFARKVQINVGSLQQYMIGDHFPRLENLEKIAIANRWTREELEAYLDDRQIAGPGRPLNDILQDVRRLSSKEALEVIRVASEVIESEL